MAKEIELKYSLNSAEQAEEILAHPMIQAELCAPVQVISMDSVYYDTEEKSLLKSKISLRRRRENDDIVYTVKTPKSSDGALSSRGEWQVKAASIDEALPKLRAAGAPEKLFELLENSELVPCAHVTFVRKTAPVKLGAELCLDVGFFGKTPFAEMELELTDGSVSDLTEFGERCAQVFGLNPETRSKFKRARAVFSSDSK